MTPSTPPRNFLKPRLVIGFTFTILGFLLFVLGVEPGIFGLDRSPVVGFVQITVFVIGLGVLCAGGYFTLNALWNGLEKSIAADFGFRLVSTGYVLCLVSGMADVFGFGSHPLPGVPFFGPWQAVGVILGELIIVIGFILFIPPLPRR